MNGRSVEFRCGGIVAALWALSVMATAGVAVAQPSQAQIGAVKSNCRSDYMAHCSSVTPGGAEALNCLQNNAPRLSGACRAAVDALKPPPAAAAPAPKPAAAPAAAPAPAAVPARAPATAAAPTAAPKQPPRTQAAKPPQQPKQAPRTAAAPAAPAAAPAPEFVYVPMPPLLPRVQLAVVRACDGDRQAVCSMVPLGGGRIIDCLARNEPSLSPYCRQTIGWARSTAR
jgi:hypothetical protein